MKSKLYSILKDSSHPLSAADMWEGAEVHSRAVMLTWVGKMVSQATSHSSYSLLPSSTSFSCTS